MVANGFGDLLSFIASIFRTIFDRLDHFYLVGTFSLLDALIAFIIIDIIITALFVTFNVHVGGDSERIDTSDSEARQANMRRREEQSRYSHSSSASFSSSANGKPHQRY